MRNKILGLLAISVISLALAACGDGGARESVDRSHTSVALPKASATVSSTYVAITSEQLFSWAEAAYPSLFPAGDATATLNQYRYRYYPATDIYLAVADGEVLALGSRATNNKVVSLGGLQDFSRTVLGQAKTIDYYRELLPSPAYQNYDAAYEFAERHKLTAFHLDAIYRLEPGTLFRRSRVEGQPPSGKPLPTGGAAVAGFALPFQQIIEVPADPAQVRYPQDFNSTAARQVSIPDPYCAIEPEMIRFPVSFLGAQPLPEVRVPSQLPRFERVVYFKDVWGKPNANFVPGCVRDPRELFSATVRRLKKLGADTIVLFPWTSFDNTSARWKVLNPSQTRSSTMGDEDLEWAVAEAKRAGLAVIWRNQIQGFQDAQGNYLPFPQANSQNVLNSFDALDDFLAERGAFLQRIGVDGVSITPWYWTSFADALSRDQFFARTRQNIEKIRAAGFSGRIFHDLVDGMPADPYFSREIHMFAASVWSNMTEAEAARATVEQFKQQFSSAVEAAKSRVAGRKILWEAMFASRIDAFSNVALEETFCSSGYGIEGGTFTGECLQEKKTTDFGLQARATQALFEIAFEVAPELVGGVGVAYWMDDNLLPSFTFPNLATSLRGKPAEQVVYRWFRR